LISEVRHEKRNCPFTQQKERKKLPPPPYCTLFN
jgi:hypothetical protein